MNKIINISGTEYEYSIVRHYYIDYNGKEHECSNIWQLNCTELESGETFIVGVGTFKELNMYMDKLHDIA